MIKPPPSPWRFAAWCRDCDYERMFRHEFQRDDYAAAHVQDFPKHIVELRTLVKWTKGMEA